MRSNTSRAVEAAASYIDSLYRQGKSVLLQTFSGELCSGTIYEQEIMYNPLRVTITMIDEGTAEKQTFDLEDVAVIQPMA